MHLLVEPKAAMALDPCVEISARPSNLIRLLVKVVREEGCLAHFAVETGRELTMLLKGVGAEVTYEPAELIPADKRAVVVVVEKDSVSIAPSHVVVGKHKTD